MTAISDIFNITLIGYLIFLAVYGFIFFIVGIFNRGSSESNGRLRVIRIIDIIYILFNIIFIFTNYSSSSLKGFSANLSNSLSDFKKFAENPYSIFTVLVFLFALYTVIFLVGIPMTASLKPILIMIIENITLLVFVILLIVDFFKYVLRIDLLNLTLDTLINDLNSPSSTTTPATDNSTESTPISSCQPKITEPPGEVFNIRNNLYTYDEAREVCSIYGAKLASYDQVEHAYNKGAEWCIYGWSEGQMALFPTQKKTWDALQVKNKNKCDGKSNVNNACGRPGINGGIIKNPNVRFGVNCYGKKPPASDYDKSLMQANVETKVTESPKDAELQAKLNVWKQNSDKFLLVNSFNKTEWSGQ
jgi:hypothetical protein